MMEFTFRERRDVEAGFIEHVRSQGEGVESTARKIGRGRLVVDADGQPVTHSFGGDVRPILAGQRLGGLGLRAIDQVLIGFEFPSWGTIFKAHDNDPAADALVKAFWRAVAEVALAYAVHGRRSRHPEPGAWCVVAACPLPEEGQEALSRARELLSDYARGWAGTVGALPGNERLGVQAAREVAA